MLASRILSILFLFAFIEDYILEYSFLYDPNQFRIGEYDNLFHKLLEPN